MDIGLDHHRQFFGLAFLDARQHLLEATAALGGEARLALGSGAEIRDVPGPGLQFDHHEIVAGLGRTVQAQHLDGNRGSGFFHGLAVLVGQRAHPAELAAGDEDVANLEGTPMHQDRGNRTPAALQLGLDHHAFGVAVRVGLELQQLGLECDGLDQLVQVGLFRGRDLDREHVAAHVLDHQIVL